MGVNPIEILSDSLSTIYDRTSLVSGKYVTGNYIVDPTTIKICALAFRRNNRLTSINYTNCLSVIGDAAFSLCPSLTKVEIPASVQYIGAAAFCASGLETVTFLGVPEIIEHSAFSDCKNLKCIYIPKGTKEHFSKMLPNLKNIFVEGIQPSVAPTTPIIRQTINHIAKTNKHTTFTYNYHDFDWSIGTEVDLDILFSGPTTLYGDPSYQFRRKALFIFMKSRTAQKVSASEMKYSIPAYVDSFLHKSQEKYNGKLPRTFIFTCDDGKHATFLDEIRIIGHSNTELIVKSILKS